MSKAGFATLYLTEPTFTSWIRFLVAMPYCPLAELPDAVDEAAAWVFNPELPEKQLERVTGFQTDTIVYFKGYWMNGPFSPITWNYWQHSRGNTNNR